MFSARIENVYDSHIHWWGTGSWNRRLDLRDLNGPEGLKALAVTPRNYRGEWLVGRGWDQNRFANPKFPNRHDLDRVFGETPVYFTRVDGHAAWVNTAALKRAGLFRENVVSPAGGDIPLGSDRLPTGILIDLAMPPVEAILPAYTEYQIIEDLLLAQNYLHTFGITHIRDLTVDRDQLSAAHTLVERGDLQLAVEQYFGADAPADFPAALQLCLAAKANTPALLRPLGVKVFYDGALGSEGALLSQPYLTSKGLGLELMTTAELQDMMSQCFDRGVDLAVHVIGDEAAHRVIQVASEVQPKFPRGTLHLEHLELLRPDTLQILKTLRVVCHMQPCHWLTDKLWLKKKIGPLMSHAFRWRDLEMNGVPFDFGSDVPIEEPGLLGTFRALTDSADAGIPAMQGDWTKHHSHHDLAWPGNTYTEFRDGRASRIVFAGKEISPNRL